jgi:peptidoglycan-N-acetylglucosamine deacetylase
MRFIRSPKLARKVFPSALWRVKSQEKVLYLSFDDGPTARTRELLNLLQKHQAKATFFCVGQNVLNNQVLFNEIRAAGHQVGNHSFSHCKGWKVSTRQYLEDVDKAQVLIQSELFRPPYGKMTLGQYRALRKKYRVVMWSHISYDFDPKMAVDTFIQKLQKDFKGGEIVVLHDNLKYFDRSIDMLRQILTWTSANGIRCLAINAKV